MPRRLRLEPFLSTLSIRTKDRDVVRLEPNWAQRQIVSQVEQDYEAGRPSRIIVLKARQLGVSTLSEALLFAWATLFAGTNAVVVAHDASSSEVLFNMTKLYYETWPYRRSFKHRYATRRQLSLDTNGSNIWVMTAGGSNASGGLRGSAGGRGRTIHAMHASECAFWGDPMSTMLAMNQAIPSRPGTLQILESTANGIGNWWEQQWNDAVEGRTDYVPMFFPWWQHPEYVRDAAGVRPRDSEERELVKLGCDAEHLAWRRWAIPNLCFGNLDLFLQEYPHTAEAAFISSGINAFPEPYLRQVYEPLDPEVGRIVKDTKRPGQVRFVPDPKGPVRVYKHPSGDREWGRYFVGADPSYGTLDGDMAAAHVISRRTKEQVAVWHGRTNPVTFADELAAMGTYYNDAMISPEVSGPGLATIGRLVSIYPHLWHHKAADRYPGQNESVSMGWSTNWQRKQWMVTQMAEMIESGAVLLHDRATYRELRAYSFYGGNFTDVFGPPTAGGSDDLVMALGIALVCDGTEPDLIPYESRPSRLGNQLIMPAAPEEVEPWAG